MFKQLFKRLIIVVIIMSFVIPFTNVFALNVGDKLGNILYSDIKVYINDYQIPSYNVNKKTVIVVEDLKNYGFKVVWDSKEKTLSVSRDYKLKMNPIKIEENKKSSGSIAFPYFFTNIVTYINGKEVESLDANGKTLIYFESLGEFGKFSWDDKNRSSKLKLNEENKYIFELSDSDIKNAIKDGEKGIQNVLIMEQDYIVTPKERPEYSMGRNTRVKILTPYLFLAQNSAINAIEYNNLSFEDAKDKYNDFSKNKLISIIINLSETAYESQSSTPIAVFQSNKKISSVDISGLTGFPKHSSSYPKYPAYERNVAIYINQDDIDINKPIQIKINFIVEEVIYEINLKDYK